MAGTPIILSGQQAASTSDILQGTRLQSVDEMGVLLFELQCSDNDATNNMSVTIQLPGGDTPMTATRIPCGNTSGLAGVLDERTNLTASFVIKAGGHTTFSCTEAGTAELTWRVTYTPAS